MNGGTAPYSFTWSGAVGQTGFVATGLSAGSQTVTATDANGCSTVDTFVINEPAQGMSGLLVGQDALCDGVSNGELGAIVQGGTGSYSYLWSDGQTTVVADLIAAGSYSLTVTDASGCALVLNGSIGQASAVSVTASVQQSVTCAGGSDAIAVAQSASGGTPDYSYVWSDALGQTGQTANGLTVGIYTVVATDSNFCTGSSTVTITEPTAMTVVASIDDASCNGLSDGQINIVSSNKVIANYSWSAGLGNPLLGLSAGTYELTATDVDGCQDSFSYSVTEPDALLSDIALQSSISCNGSADGAAIVSSSGGSPSYTYAWNNGTSGNSLSNLGPGNYTVTVTDAKGCTETESISLSEPNELTISGSTTGTLCAGDATGIIEASGLGGTVVVGMLEYSLDGSSWQQGNLFSGLTSGIYDLQVRDENGCIASTQVVVEDADPLFISAMTPNLSVEYLDSISISATLNDTTGVSYSWTQLEGSTLGLITDSSYQFEINPIEKVSYLFSATNSRGCRVDSIVIIEVRKPRRASAPTGFTPNGDGVNDYFFVQGGEKIAEVALFRVYDRWGSLVFEGQSLEVNIAEQGWNGSFRGQECSSGAYIWYADIRFKDGEITQLKGEVVLLR
jgi:gliding motility-associated-like protein